MGAGGRTGDRASRHHRLPDGGRGGDDGGLVRVQLGGCRGLDRDSRELECALRASSAAGDVSERVYTVAALIAEINTLLEQGFSGVQVEGEVTNASTSGRGHI